MPRFDLRLFAPLVAALAFTAPAAAHPHVFVDARVEIVFDPQGRITAVRNIWQFDEAFTSYATLNLDADNNSELSDAELEPLARTNVESLKEFDFFTYLTVGGKKGTFVEPSEYFLQFHNSRLTLYYTLPLAEPMMVDAPAELEVFDPEYFVAFSFVPEAEATLDGAPVGCTTTYRPPGELDAQTMTILGAIPADQRTIPDDLVEAASVLANVITITCPTPGVMVASEPPPAPAAAPPPVPRTPFGVGTSDAPSGAWLTGPVGPFFRWIAERQAGFYRALTANLDLIKTDGSAAWLLLTLSLLYGVFHAAGPGHGKVVITGYLFATGASLRRGIALSFASAFVQAATAIAIVGVAAVIFKVAADTMTVATLWIELASYVLIVIVGLWLVWAKTFGGGHHHHHDHAGHDHPNDHDDDHDHHDYAPPSRAGLVSAILSVGIRPCSGAIIVLVFALSQGLFALGVASALVMAVGTGLTVAVLATLAVSARGLAVRLAGADSVAAYRVIRGLEIAAALAVLVLGLVLLGGSLASGLPS